jgi:1,4-dihydroxy-6-naphthoate synthase
MCPGSGTTASFLFQHFHPEVPYIVQGVFSGIPSAVAAKHVDVGVLIHEGRFTFEDQGLRLVEDLGDRWEKSYQLPLPLGGLFAKQSLSTEVLEKLVNGVQESLHYAYAHREEVLDTMARYAQEFSPDVLWKHVDLYVNSETFILSEKGRTALNFMFDVANEGGLLGIAAPPLIIL